MKTIAQETITELIIIFSLELNPASVSTEDIAGSVSRDGPATVFVTTRLSPALIIPSLLPLSTSMLTLSFQRFIHL